jgi:hypothetical protein
MLLEMAEVLAMRIPEAVGHGHAARSRLDKAAGHQELIVPHRRAITEMSRRAAAITLANRRRLARDIESIDQLARGQHVEGAFVIRVHAGAVAPVGITLPLIDLFEQPPAVPELIEG